MTTLRTPLRTLLRGIAKGGLLVGSGQDAVGRLAAGADAQVLTFDSAQTLGVKWATPAAGATIGLVTADFLFTTSSTALQDITGLTFSIGASATEIWFFELFLRLTAANTTMDWKFAVKALPASATIEWNHLLDSGQDDFRLWAAASTPVVLYGAAQVFPQGSAGAGTFTGWWGGWVFGGGTAGAIQFQGAQNTSDAGQLTAKKGCFVRATKLAA